MWVAFSPDSTRTAYTTASEVVDRAIPPIWATFQSQPTAAEHFTYADLEENEEDLTKLSEPAHTSLRLRRRLRYRCR